MMRTFFVDVILPLPLDATFTYRVPKELEAKVAFGVRVIVPFGRNRLYSAVVAKVHETPPKQVTAKYILDVMDESPVVSEKQYRLWEWMAQYYMCSTNEVMTASLPSALRLAGETVVMVNPNFDGDVSVLSPKELNVVEILASSGHVTVGEIGKRLQLAKIMPLVKSLVDKKVIITDEEIKNPYKPKRETVVSISGRYSSEATFMALLDELNDKPQTARQADTLLAFMMCARKDGKYDFKAKLPKHELLKNDALNPNSLNTLVKKGILVVEERVVSRLKDYSAESRQEVCLSVEQQKAFDEINTDFESSDVVLLHGVTGSGKTEIYIRLIEEQLKKNKQVLYMLPEIALTSQIVNRLRRCFGDDVGVYHSRFNEYERVEIWQRVLNADQGAGHPKYRLILGTRSALLLPFSNLGLIIVDEEHDGSYKQVDPAPRYHARDTAVVLAKLHNAKTLLGSATPSLESYHNAQTGKYALVQLLKRYADSKLPDIFTVNMNLAVKRKEVEGIYSKFLTGLIAEALEKHEQVIIFQNRRGYSVRMLCHSCEYMPSCKYCDVTLTYHKRTNLLKCHYCGYAVDVPHVCPVCGSRDIEMVGFGTEQVEDTLSEIFPDARIVRMDLDSTRSKNAYQQIITDFEQKKTDILVGTQMVTKGLDFDRVSVVGILNADPMLSFPDFRAFERAFQLLSQVSGRAGRKDVPGKVVIQTFQPNHLALKYVEANDYGAMYESQISERRKFKLPPITRMIKLTLKHHDEKLLYEAAACLQGPLRAAFPGMVTGPATPLVARVQNQYLVDFWIKIAKDNSSAYKKQQLADVLGEFKSLRQFRQVRCVVNVDA